MDKIKTLLGSYRQITLEPVFLLFCVNLGLIGITTQADLQALLDAWNNGNRDPSWGVAEIQKMSPSTTGRCYCCH